MGKAVRLKIEQDSKGLDVNIKTKYLDLLQRFCGADKKLHVSGLKLAHAY